MNTTSAVKFNSEDVIFGIVGVLLGLFMVAVIVFAVGYAVVDFSVLSAMCAVFAIAVCGSVLFSMVRTVVKN